MADATHGPGDEMMSAEELALWQRIESLEVELQHANNLLFLANQEIAALKDSESYKLGLGLTAPLRALRKAIAPPAAAPPAAPPPAATLAQEIEEATNRRAELDALVAALPSRPLVSIIMPVWNTPPDLLRRALASVAAQVYPEWEVCIGDDGSTSADHEPVLREFLAAHPTRAKLTRLTENRGIAVASATAASMATGEWIAFLDHDDVLSPDALLEVIAYAHAVPDADFIYSDEDKIDAGGGLVDPHHKPEFSPELLLCHNYICHFVAMRRALFESCGGFRPGFDGSQDWDLVLRATEKARRVGHVARILYHWGMAAGSTAVDAAAKGGRWRESSRAVLRSAIERRGWNAEVLDGLAPDTYRVRFATNPASRVCAIIPTKDRIDLLAKCIASLRGRLDWKGLDILVISNNSERPETIAWLDEAQRRGDLRYIRHDAPFNYSALNNLGARNTDAPYLLFLNDDIEAIDPSWLAAMMEHAQRPDVGIVGAALVYPSNIVQHAGVLLGVNGVAGHAFRDVPWSSTGDFCRLKTVRNYSAVTAACMLVRRDAFERVGGFDESIAVAFNDVDFCLRVRDAGFRIVYTPHACLIHHESASRGQDDTPEKRRRFHAEINTMRQRWRGALYRDPFFNPNLSLLREDFTPRSSHDGVRERDFVIASPSPRDGVFHPATTVGRRTHLSRPAERRLAASSGPARPRAAYQDVWEGLSTTRHAAVMHVSGYDDEDRLRREGQVTLNLLRETVGINPTDVVLEIGCGVGRVGEALAPIVREWVGCDVSRHMLKYTAERLAGRANVRLVHVNGWDLSAVADASIDVVYSTVVFMHLDEWDRYHYILEAMRVLRPGGRLYVDNFNLDSDEGWHVFDVHRRIPPLDRPPHISKASTVTELRVFLQRAGYAGVGTREDGLWAVAWGTKPATT